MRLTNDSYLVTLRFNSGVEQYFRDGEAWTKLPGRAGVKPGVDVVVEHRDVSEAAGHTLDRLRGGDAL
jgi:hypothetical protein